MPLANRTTPANGNEREQVIPLLDTVKPKKPGRPRKRVKVLATDKGYDSKELRDSLRKRGIRPQLPKRIWKSKKWSSCFCTKISDGTNICLVST